MWILAPYVLAAALVQAPPDNAPSWFGPGAVANQPPPVVAPAPPDGRPVPPPESPEERRVRNERIVGVIALAALAILTIASLRLRVPVVLRRGDF